MGELYRLGHSSKNNKVVRLKLNINDDKRVNDKRQELRFAAHAVNQNKNDFERVQTAYKAYQDARAENIAAALISAQVVAMTSSYAATIMYILKKVEFEIILFDEAAEIFETHIVSVLTSHTKHMIQIEDHKQLKPSPNSNHLAKNFQLESMFERLIEGGLPFAKLRYQYRMLTVISNRIIHFYKDLQLKNLNAQDKQSPRNRK
jgi:superfamily I DNA and/or RNA helicase